MDPISLIVWGAVGIVALIVLLLALKMFGRMLIMLLVIAAFALALTFLSDPKAAMHQVTDFVSQVNTFVQQLHTAVGDTPVKK